MGTKPNGSDISRKITIKVNSMRLDIVDRADDVTTDHVVGMSNEF